MATLAAQYANYPAMAPPPGLVSNFDNPKTLSTSLITINAIFLPLMLIAVIIRLYSRGHLLHALGWDDCEAINRPEAEVF